MSRHRLRLNYAIVQHRPLSTDLYKFWTEHSSKDSSAEVQGAAVTYYIPTGWRHDEGGTLTCSKFRQQIKIMNKLQWFGPIFLILGGAMMKMVPCMLCSKFRLQLKHRTKLQWFGPIFYL